jgi:hypothetical protein
LNLISSDGIGHPGGRVIVDRPGRAAVGRENRLESASIIYPIFEAMFSFSVVASKAGLFMAAASTVKSISKKPQAGVPLYAT